jgi:hypothetical protein
MSKKFITLICVSFVLWCGLFLSAIPSLPQNAAGRFIGVVTDEQGAAIAGASVTITVTDAEMDEIWSLVPDGTSIGIRT